MDSSQSIKSSVMSTIAFVTEDGALIDKIQENLDERSQDMDDFKELISDLDSFTDQRQLPWHYLP